MGCGEPASTRQPDRRAGDVIGEHSNGVQRPRQREHPVCRHHAHGRPDADHAAQRRRYPYRSTRVGAHGQGDETCPDRRRRSGAGAARHPRRVMRVGTGTVRGAVTGRAERELVRRCLTDDDRARFAQPDDHLGVACGHVGAEMPRAHGRGDAGSVHKVLDRDGNAVQHTAVLSAGEFVPGPDRVPPGLFRRHSDERIQRRLRCLHRVEDLLHQSNWVRGPVPQRELRPRRSTCRRMDRSPCGHPKATAKVDHFVGRAWPPLPVWRDGRFRPAVLSGSFRRARGGAYAQDSCSGGRGLP